MSFFILTVISAFEFSLPAGEISGMGAGVAVGDWRQSLGFNPALTASKARLAAAVVYAQPYGLKGLNCAWTGVKFKMGNFHSVFGLQMLGLNSNNEIDIASALALPIVKGLSGGLAIHGLIQHFHDISPEIVPVFDLGFRWTIDRFSVAIALQRLNSPRFRNDDELFPRLRAGIAWELVEPVLLAIDLEKEAQVERLFWGTEFRLFPELVVRAGFETAPFSLRLGLGVRLNWLGLDYGYQYHPQIGDTHSWGMKGQWD